MLLLDEDRLRVLRELAAEVANIDGCVVELGVYCGGSALVLATCLPGRKLHLFDTFAEEVGGWIASGELKFDETVVDGIDATPEAFIGLLAGQNTGKMIVRL